MSKQRIFFISISIIFGIHLLVQAIFSIYLNNIQNYNKGYHVLDAARKNPELFPPDKFVWHGSFPYRKVELFSGVICEVDPARDDQIINGSNEFSETVCRIAFGNIPLLGIPIAIPIVFVFLILSMLIAMIRGNGNVALILLYVFIIYIVLWTLAGLGTILTGEALKSAPFG